MQQNVSWVERPTKKIGLDNLGTQQPCVTIYSRLLPGITNVTDRAVYFGFYPWFIRVFEKRYPQASDTVFRGTLRIADCLMTLIAERHAVVTNGDIGEHSASCPGRLTLGPVIRHLDDEPKIDLRRYADRSEENEFRYFKNPLGGLGQYYLGPLRDEYAILRGDPRSGVGYWLESGATLADAFGAGVNEELFFKTVDAGTATSKILDDLSVFCPCSLRSPERTQSRDALIALFFRDPSPSGATRRASLRLILDYLGRRDGAEVRDPVKAFLTSCYSGSLANEAWLLESSLEVARRGWALYARNEMLSLAWLALFKNALDALDGNPKPFPAIDSLSDWLISGAAFKYRPAASFDALIAEDAQKYPAITDTSHADHEITLWRELLDSNPPSVEVTIRLLVRLISRFRDEEGDSYSELNLPFGTLAEYPLTLNSLKTSAQKRWTGLSGEAWLKSLLCEALVTHQRIAIRKMGQSGEDTLMFRAGDLGYFVHREMERIVETQPRLWQALQIIRDLGLTTWKEGHLPKLTPSGQSLLLGLAE